MKADDIRVLRDIEQYYSTQIDEMPMNGKSLVFVTSNMPCFSSDLTELVELLRFVYKRNEYICIVDLSYFYNVHSIRVKFI